MTNVNYNSEDSYFQGEVKKLTNYLFTHVATMTMASDVLDIPQKNICWHKRFLEKSGKLWVLYKAPCKVTKRMAWYITTNPEIMRAYLKIAA